MALRMLVDDAVYMEGARQMRPAKGDVVEPSDPVVRSTLIACKLASEIRTVQVEDPPTAEIVPAPPGPELADPDPEPPPVDPATAPALTWADIPSISEASKKMLVAGAPDLDPRSATLEQLKAVLGSDSRAAFAWRALKDYLEPPAPPNEGG